MAWKVLLLNCWPALLVLGCSCFNLLKTLCSTTAKVETTSCQAEFETLQAADRHYNDVHEYRELTLEIAEIATSTRSDLGCLLLFVFFMENFQEIVGLIPALCYNFVLIPTVCRSVVARLSAVNTPPRASFRATCGTHFIHFTRS